ncbi:MAG: 50S ribosomal protein L23 [Gammaproteobacteria bacterium]|nr:50S ribosomal protein L23 [Gammaproteobacteria bacterium]MCP4128962.1 50S ribosomal protein L23 [Gammaproteobacteria bacterium]
MNKERLMQTLRSPVVSEKSTIAADTNRQFVFEVAPDSTKPEIRKAVEMMFDVEVENVRVVNIKGKAKRTGQRLGRRNGVRKAYVRLAPGNDIDFGGA